MKFDFTINGKKAKLEADPMDRLLDVLRDRMGVTGTKEGCGEGECGACTVLIGGEPVLSCLIPMLQCEGVELETVEGLTTKTAQEFIQTFVGTGGVQCGACTPGIIVSAWALLKRNKHPTREEVQEALAGNLCRCTGYEGIHRALSETPPPEESPEEEFV